MDIEAMRAKVAAHDAGVRAEKMAPLAALVASPAFAEVVAGIEALGVDLDGEARFGPFVKASRSGLTGLRRAVEREAARS